MEERAEAKEKIWPKRKERAVKDEATYLISATPDLFRAARHQEFTKTFNRALGSSESVDPVEEPAVGNSRDHRPDISIAATRCLQNTQEDVTADITSDTKVRSVQSLRRA